MVEVVVVMVMVMVQEQKLSTFSTKSRLASSFLWYWGLTLLQMHINHHNTPLDQTASPFQVAIMPNRCSNCSCTLYMACSAGQPRLHPQRSNTPCSLASTTPRYKAKPAMTIIV